MSKYKIIVGGPGSSGEVTMDLNVVEAQAMYAFADAFNGDPENQHHAAPFIEVVQLKSKKV